MAGQSTRTRCKLRLFALVLLVTCCGSTWLDPGRQSKKDDPNNDLISTQSFYHTCHSKTARCWCGSDDDRHATIIKVKHCPFSTEWGTQCEPCQPPKQSCRKLAQCARCMRDNPQAICAACPPDRHGLHCEKEYPCKPPNVTEHMTLHPRFSRKGVYRLEFRCTGGRVRQGPKSIKCSPKKPNVWNKSPPKCVLPVTCSTVPPAPVPFTRIKSNTTERVLYECDEGYRPSGNILQMALQCDNGIWVQTGPSVKCERGPKCTSLPDYFGATPVTGTPIKSVYHAGEHVVYECKAGFESVPPESRFSITCVEKRWEGRIPECVLKGCPKLTLDEGDVRYKGASQSHESDYVAVNAVAAISCHKGFVAQGSPEVTCSRTGNWEPSVPKCVTKYCEHGTMCALNGTLGNGVIYLSNETEIYPGQTVSFRCEEGWFRQRNVGDVERTCFFNGTLSGSEIVCKRVLTCEIDTSKDPHLRFCRQNGEPCTPGKDNNVDPTYDLPENVIPFGGKVNFSCSDSTDPSDSDGSFYYRVLGTSEAICMGKNLTIPSCVPVCGKKRKQKIGLIRGGVRSGIGEWPWQAALLHRHSSTHWNWMCGATLVYDRWAITAAHCVTAFEGKELLNATGLKLVYGESTRANIMRDSNKDLYNVEKVYRHPDYDKITFDNDIALLKLETRVEMGHLVGVVCLPASLECSDKQVVVGQKGVVTGWGQTETEEMSLKLREVPLYVTNKTECQAYVDEKGYSNTPKWTENMICAQSESDTQDTTSGDSGGPFVMLGEEADEWVLEGVISWGVERYQLSGVNISCAPDTKSTTSPNSSDPRAMRMGRSCYSGYTRVAKYLDWIEETTGVKRPATGGRCDHDPNSFQLTGASHGSSPQLPFGWSLKG